MKTVKVDFVSLRLNEMFDFRAFEKWLTEIQRDSKTGEVLPPKLLQDQFRVKVVTNDITVVSFYNGGEPEAIKLWRKYHLPVTRVDLCIDLELGSKDEVEQQFEGLDHDIKEWKEAEPERDQIATFRFDGRQNNRNGEFGRTLYSRSSDHHLRIYEKRKVLPHKTRVENLYGVRLEWQLKKELAKEVFPIIAKGYPNNREALFDVFQSITAKWIEPDFFHLGEYNAVEFSKSTVKEMSHFDQWVRITIPRALVRHFKTTGVDLSQQIVKDFRAILDAEEKDKAVKIRSGNQIKIDATYHNIRKKLKATDLLRPEPEDDDDY